MNERNEIYKRTTTAATASAKAKASATTVAAGVFYANVDYIELRFEMAMVCDNAQGFDVIRGQSLSEILDGILMHCHSMFLCPSLHLFLRLSLST